MKKIKLLISIIACMVLILGLTACGSGEAESDTDSGTAQSVNNTSELSDNESKESENKVDEIDITAIEETTTATVEEQAQSGNVKDTLVVYFSATGTTKGVAERIAAMEDADIYEITPAEPYSDADLDWNDKNSRTTKEQNDTSVRPAIGSEAISLEGYKTIYIGYPIWWGEEPRIMDTFVENYNFEGITMIPFCTSGGSGIGRSGTNLADNAGSGNWLDGDRLQSSISDEDLQAWINSYK